MMTGEENYGDAVYWKALEAIAQAGGRQEGIDVSFVIEPIAGFPLWRKSGGARQPHILSHIRATLAVATS
jgi:hypothetical protein